MVVSAQSSLILYFLPLHRAGRQLDMVRMLEWRQAKKAQVSSLVAKDYATESVGEYAVVYAFLQGDLSTENWR